MPRGAAVIRYEGPRGVSWKVKFCDADGRQVKETLGRGEKIKISGFGNFVVRAKKQRIGRNPQTGAPIPISARRVLTFKPSQVLKGVLNPHKERGSAGGDDASDTSSTPNA